ncbi:MAG: hypothetical protein U0798_10955 [Gemmataceae bacterium]
MRKIVLSAIFLAGISGCALCDQGRCRDDLPPNPDQNSGGMRQFDFSNMHWFGPAKETPINPPIPNLPPTREPTAPRAEDPSWRNR